MCGIAAALPADDAFVAFALARQQSRGPDDQVAINLGFCCLGVNRLAISGLNGGDQPLQSSDGSVIVVFNGAIYNNIELIEQFALTPKSTNDGEVIHELYRKFGMAFADYLEGMFAICIADLNRKELILAVDQVGIKPLYVCRTKGQLYCASNIASFPAALRMSVTRMPPDMVWSSSGQMSRIVHRTHKNGSVGELLWASVRQQIPREVGWGCMLSGGVDSALITRLASEVSPDVTTFTCGTADSPDMASARELADIVGSTHHEIILNPEELPSIVDEIVEATASFEPWTVNAGVGAYLVARTARSIGLKVLLTGEGADELFGGYDEFQEVPDVFLNSMLLQYQVELGTTECLRLDRGSMAQSIEARVPYLSTSLMRHVRSLGPQEKIRRDGPVQIRKFALREFAATVLPKHIAYREKAEFSHGSGLTLELQRLAAQRVSIADIADLRGSFPSFPIMDTMTAWYFSKWLAIFGMSMGHEWNEMVGRGLFRQRLSRYLPIGTDSAVYA